MADPRYKARLKTLNTEELGSAMQRAMRAAQRQFPDGTGVIVFAFDFGEGGGMAYIANGQRDDCIAALEEWITKQRLARN
jgi:hypothetical protein